MRSLTLALLAVASCATHPEFVPDRPVPGGHGSGGIRFHARLDDARKASAGLIPILITADGAPRPGARFEAEPSDSWCSEPSSAGRESFRRPHLDDQTADARGVVWWKPDEQHPYWSFIASFEGRRETEGYWSGGIGGQPYLESAARHSVAWYVMDLPPLERWTIRVEPRARACELPVPIFISDGASVWHRLDSSTIEHWIPRYPEEIEGRNRQPSAIWAGFDRSNVIELRDAHQRDVLLPLGETGCIELELRDESGNLVREPREVILESSDSPRAIAWPDHGLPGSMSMTSGDGRVHFAAVPLGRSWTAVADLLDDGLLVARRFTGPLRGGETVVELLDASAESVEIRGTLEEPDGAPAASLDFVCQLGNDPEWQARFRTDAAGAFALRLSNFALETEMRVWLRDLVPEGDASRSLFLSPEELLINPLHLRFPPHERVDYAAGRIVDVAGNPHHGARVLGAEHYVGTHGANFWIREPWPPRDEMTVWAADSWHHPLNCAIAPRGRRDVELRVAQGSRIAAGLHPDHIVAFRGWRVSGDFADHVNRVSPEFDWGPCGHGWFEIGPIPVEATEVTIDFGEAGTAVLRDLKLEAGKVYRHPQVITPRK